VLAGTSLSADAFAALRRDANPGIVVERFRPDFPALLRRCHVSVSQAGYNTALDVVSARARAVLVPFTAERETEQLIRAEHLAARGAVELVRESELSATVLAAAIERAATRDPTPIRLATDGARRSAETIAAMIIK
jgi:predicted glycosyltransferase